MKRSMATFGAAVALVAGIAWATALQPADVAAEGPEIPGMCNGRTDPNVVLTAHANGRSNGVPKYILNLWTDSTGKPFGVLILGRGENRLIVEEWCRLWQHVPGQEPEGGSGQCEADDHEGEVEDEGATIAHAVGIGRLRDGTKVLVRTDVRGTEEGMFFRVRYREMGAHHEEVSTLAEDDGCEDDSWTRVPLEGWAPLDQLRLNTGIPLP